jgi:hypothetical protein
MTYIMRDVAWDGRVLDEVVEWLLGLDDDTYDQVAAGLRGVE